MSTFFDLFLHIIFKNPFILQGLLRGQLYTQSPWVFIHYFRFYVNLKGIFHISHIIHMWKNVYNYNYLNKDCVKPLFIIIYIRIFMSVYQNTSKIPVYLACHTLISCFQLVF